MQCPCALCRQTLAGSDCCAQMPGPLRDSGCLLQTAGPHLNLCYFHGASHGAFHLPAASQAVKDLSYDLPSSSEMNSIKTCVTSYNISMPVASLCASSVTELLMGWGWGWGSWVSQRQGRFTGIFTGCWSQGCS